jgi:hypothetical protein
MCQLYSAFCKVVCHIGVEVLTLVMIESVFFWCVRPCGLVVKVPGYRFRGPGFDSRHYQII